MAQIIVITLLYKDAFSSQSIYFFSSWDSGNNMLVVAQPFDYEDVASYPDFPNVTICK